MTATDNVIKVYYVKDENEDKIPDEYQIIFSYVSAGNGNVNGEINEVHTFTDTEGNYIMPTPISPVANVAVNANEKYAFDYWSIDGDKKDYHVGMDILKADTYIANTTFTVYFDEDKIGTKPDSPDTPDGIPDKYQVVFEYRSEDVNRGTISGTIKEVVTRPQNVDGSYNMDALVYPLANVTVSNIGRYYFSNWTDGTVNYNNVDNLRTAGFSQNTIFTAEFGYREGGNTGGGGGGTGGGRVTPTVDGGPGVTILPEAVPLAQLPGAPVDPTVIGDGEIPLAALPKTGQSSVKSTLTMMMSGIFLMLTAMSKKRKEEDS